MNRIGMLSFFRFRVQAQSMLWHIISIIWVQVSPCDQFVNHHFFSSILWKKKNFWYMNINIIHYINFGFCYQKKYSYLMYKIIIWINCQLVIGGVVIWFSQEVMWSSCVRLWEAIKVKWENLGCKLFLKMVVCSLEHNTIF